MESSRTHCKDRTSSAMLLVVMANLILAVLLSESSVGLLLSDDVLNATYLGPNALERSHNVSHFAVPGQLNSLYFDKAYEAQNLQGHRRNFKPRMVTDVTKNRKISDSRGIENAIEKNEDLLKVLEYVTGEEEAFENSGELAEELRVKEEEKESAIWLQPQAKLALNPINGSYEETKLEEMATEHEREIEENAYCQFPVPEVICIKALYTDITKDYNPRCTVVFRCRPRSGCCEYGSVCHVKNSSSIIRAFREISYVDGSHLSRIQLFRFTNHTGCYCKPIADFPDCKDCPESFERFEKAPGICDCYCDRKSHNYKHCLSTTQGMSKLTKSDLKCIQQDNCYKPACDYGPFNITSGLCPCTRNDSLQRRKCLRRQTILLLSGLNL